MKYQCGKCENIFEVVGIKESVVTCSKCGSKNSIKESVSDTDTQDLDKILNSEKIYDYLDKKWGPWTKYADQRYNPRVIHDLLVKSKGGLYGVFTIKSLNMLKDTYDLPSIKSAMMMLLWVAKAMGLQGDIRLNNIEDLLELVNDGEITKEAHKLFNSPAFTHDHG